MDVIKKSMGHCNYCASCDEVMIGQVEMQNFGRHSQ